jgi:antitoxin CptB
MSVVRPLPPAPYGPASRDAAADAQLRRLYWKCRRGMKELDVLLERFAQEVLPYAGDEERVTFAQLLALPDPLLLQYLLGGSPPPEAGLARLVGRIQALCRSGDGSGVFCR